jgi:hypothetical protein
MLGELVEAQAPVAGVVEETMFMIEVVRYSDGAVLDRRGPYQSERDADRIDRGLNINLDTEKFYTRVLPVLKETDD